jgi:hypothetical protein|tara:strand:- start:505 stop:708 length:204 start_codon:yes stop_codon:yes gene_type:complete
MLTLISKLLGFFNGITNLFNRSKDRQAGRNEVKVAMHEENEAVRGLASAIKSKRKRDRLLKSKRNAK